MATQRALDSGPVILLQAELSRKVRRTIVAVPAIILVGGLTAMALAPRAAIFSAALILGWTQLAGL